ncbi:MAG TPA: hypothetical protein VMZ92_13490 [Planctomycetota bacterium]|nr:hypothetical protein [Planctomycetota bacterium]
MRGFVVLLFLAAVFALPAEGATRVEVVRDSSVVLVDNEWHLNQGRLDRIRIKGNQHLLPMTFDLTPLKGKLVKSATLVCRQGAARVNGLTLSTLQAPWDEYTSNSMTSGVGPETGWGRPGAHFPSVTGGNAFSLVCQAVTDLKDGTYYWKVDPDLVHACAVGASYGITLHEVDVDYSRNPTIWSREARGREPHLVVEFGGTEPKPQPPTDLKVTHSGNPETLRLHLRAPKNGFTYDVRVDGQTLPRWNTPFVQPGKIQVIPIRDLSLKGGDQTTISVATVNRLGETSRPVSIRTTVPKPEPVTFPEIRDLPKASHMDMKFSVIPAFDKYDISGKPVGDLPAGYGHRNAVCIANGVTLSAARGEVVGFQVLLRGEGKVRLTCRLPGVRTEMFRALYVDSKAGRIPDPLVPFEELELSPDVATPVVVDVYVPFDFKQKSVDGEITVSDGRRVPIRLKVRNFAIPREASFLCEMNGYGMPDSAEEFYRLQRIAYDHRVHVNILSYSHSSTAPGARKCRMDLLMPDGRRMDERRYNDIKPGAKRGYWNDFITVFGPYLSGECFKDGHRGPVAAPGFYLTFHESWPLKVRDHFNGNPDACEAFKGSPAYAETFVNVLEDFIATAKREGWTRTGFQLYLNNKGSLNDRNKSPWILDEPTSYWDYRALNYFGELVQRAKGRNCPVRIDYRIDISRPQFDRGQLRPGTSDLWVVNGGAFKKYPRLVADRREREGLTVWTYGTSNRVEDTNRNIHALVLETYRDGASGFVPWQTINRDGSALTRADQLGIFIFDRPEAGRRPIHHSMRLKAYRRAEQDVEYLELLRKRRGWSDGQVRAFIDHYVDLSGEVVKTSAADAGTARYGRLSAEGFRRLREAAAELLEKPQPAAGSRNP